MTAATAVPAFAQSEDKLTGLDRAHQATMQALEQANSRAAEARGELPPGLAKKDAEGKLTGRDRAEAAIARGLARGNGNGNANGRSHAATVLQQLLDGKSPASLADDKSHGAEVSAMVRAHNELRRQERAGG
jgi:hypothetical protein